MTREQVRGIVPWDPPMVGKSHYRSGRTCRSSSCHVHCCRAVVSDRSATRGRREADVMARTTLRAKGQLTLPDDVRKAAKLEEGDLIDVVVSENGEIILRPLVAVD